MARHSMLIDNIEAEISLDSIEDFLGNLPPEEKARVVEGLMEDTTAEGRIRERLNVAPDPDEIGNIRRSLENLLTVAQSPTVALQLRDWASAMGWHVEKVTAGGQSPEA